MSAPAPRAILIALSQQDGQERAVLAALYTRLLRRPGWVAYLLEPARLTPEAVRAMPLDAVVGRLEPSVADRVAKRVPVVSTVPGRYAQAYSVVTDDAVIGRTAAEYFIGRRFRDFAYVGSGRTLSQGRRAAFADRLSGVGGVVRTFQGPDTGATPWDPSATHRELTDWVRALPTPAAVLAESDMIGFRVSEICRNYRIPIPDHLSLMGVGNDDLMCRLCQPPLTTIATATETIGVTIAQLLDRLFAGQAPEQRVVMLPHAGVVERQSANIIRTDDAEVAAAVRYIRANAQKPITIDQIVSAVPTSRRTLERRFRRVMGVSLQDAVTEARVERAKALLAYSRSPIQKIAGLSGFASAQRFHIVFRRATGTTPQAYRQQFQSAGLDKAASRP